VSPQFDDLFFGLEVGWVGTVQALEHFAHISHVEDVVRLCRDWQEVVLDQVEQGDSRSSKWFRHILDLLKEGLEFMCTYRLEDVLHLCMCGNRVVENMEFRLDSRRYHLSSATRFTHSSNDLHITNLISNNLLAIIPEVIIHPLPNKFKWWLRTKRISPWHVEIINKANNSLLSTWWLIFILGSKVEM